jgi:hypothetical protein
MPKQFLTDIDLNGRKITELADPTAGTDGANKDYVDDQLVGLTISDLAALAGYQIAALDEFPLVDKSDTTDSADGTTKRMTAADIAVAMYQLGLQMSPCRSGDILGSPAVVAGGTGNLGDQRLLLIPIVVPRYLSNGIDRLNVNVGSAGSSGSIIRVGLYASDLQGVPTGNPLCDATVSGESTGVKEVTVSTGALLPGLYHAGCVGQGNPSTKPDVYRQDMSFRGPWKWDPSSHIACFYVDSVSGALPNSISVNSDINDRAFIIRCRVA